MSFHPDDAWIRAHNEFIHPEILAPHYADDLDYGHPRACEVCGDEADCDCKCCNHPDGDRMCSACCAKAGPCNGCAVESTADAA